MSLLPRRPRRPAPRGRATSDRRGISALGRGAGSCRIVRQYRQPAPPSKLQLLPVLGTAFTVLVFFLKGVDVIPGDYSLSDVLERLYENQQAPQAAIMELTLLVEEQGMQ